MATGSASPTARRWELAARLRELRVASGLPLEEVAAALLCSPAKISRMETAGRGVQPRDIRDLCRLYRVPPEREGELMDLARDARRQGWWADFRSIDEQTGTFVGLESAAEHIHQVQSLVLPGLVQAPEYTRALVAGIRPPGEIPAGVRDEWVKVRQIRQQRVRSGALKLSVVIDESAFTREIGSAAVMVGQVEWILQLRELPNVTVQVVPYAVGAHPALDGSVQVLHFGAGQLADVAFVEGLLGQFIIDKPAHVQAYLDVFDHMAASVALSRSETAEWLGDEKERWTRRAQQPDASPVHVLPSRAP